MGGKGSKAKAKEPRQADPQFGGPIKNRGCTDVVCCVIFVIFLLCYAAVSVVAIYFGNPMKLLYPTDTEGNVCGIKNSNGRDMSNKPYLFYFDLTKCANTAAVASTLNCPTTQVCVESCPSIYWIGYKDIAMSPSPQVDESLYICKYDYTVRTMPRRPRPLWKWGSYVAKRPGYIPPKLREAADGKVRPYEGFRRRDPALFPRAHQVGFGGAFTRMSTIQIRLTELIKLERLEVSYSLANALRPYMERLLSIASKRGDEDVHAMDLADYYIRDKAMIHKLFKVLVPRFKHKEYGEYVRIFRVPPRGDGMFFGQTQERAVIELTINPFPLLESPVVPVHPDNLLNVLMRGVVKDFERNYFDQLAGIGTAAKKHLKTPGKLDSWTNYNEGA